VLVPGRVPSAGMITREERHVAGVTVLTSKSRSTTAPAHADLASLIPLSPNVKRVLTVRDRDLSGGVPEAD
jgi:hypothetical protein